MAAPERLGELRGLTVSDVVGDFTHREVAPDEHLRSSVHPHAGQVLAKGRVAYLGERALQLATRGGNALGKLVERQLAGVFELDNRADFAVELCSKGDCCWPLHREMDTATSGSEMTASRCRQVVL